MKCPFCGEDTTKVIDSRPSDDNTAIRRRRMCEVCNRRFTTYEKIEVFPLMVVKKDQTREAYSMEKLKTGIVMACHKRPIPTDAVNRLVDDIETTIFNNYEKEVSSKVIGELVMEKLKTLDEVAYVRFAYNFSGDGNGKILRGKSYQRTSDSCAKAAFCRLRSCVADGTGRI